MLGILCHTLFMVEGCQRLVGGRGRGGMVSVSLVVVVCRRRLNGGINTLCAQAPCTAGTDLVPIS